MPRVLLLATTTGYQTKAFGDAASHLGIEIVYATDRCHQLDDPWRDAAVPIRFHDEPGSVDAILESSRERPLDGVLALGDRPAVIAASVLRKLGLPGNPPEAVASARNKLIARERFRAAGLLTPWFTRVSMTGEAIGTPPAAFPCVVKPLGLSGSRGVMRANTDQELAGALVRLRALLHAPDILAERSDVHESALVEEFIPGREFALEGVLEHGSLRVFALFDKPDPLDGPFFEETIYVTPSRGGADVEQAIVDAITTAARALGLRHGPIHAECRVNDRGVFVLEVAPRPIGGLCARVLRFHERDGAPFGLEEALLRHALGESTAAWTRERNASGVMMIPIPKRGVYRRVDGINQARVVDGIDEVRITAKEDQVLVPLPEGASYLGFIFARAGAPELVEDALRRAHGRLRFVIDPEMPMLQSQHGR
ncbi:MAG TPA: ATP-grasp domain-containing protein [Vicinamibacterales bacterium]|jgi:biotin carboxylase|nr:ATP-grasp domain-containing protein [Vicinamibacterales bacterium]